MSTWIGVKTAMLLKAPSELQNNSIAAADRHGSSNFHSVSTVTVCVRKALEQAGFCVLALCALFRK